MRGLEASATCSSSVARVNSSCRFLTVESTPSIELRVALGDMLAGKCIMGRAPGVVGIGEIGFVAGAILAEPTPLSMSPGGMRSKTLGAAVGIHDREIDVRPTGTFQGADPCEKRSLF